MKDIHRCGLVMLLVLMLSCGSDSTSSTAGSSGGSSSSSAWTVVTSSGAVVEGTSFIGSDQSNLLATGGVTKGTVSGDFAIMILPSDTTNGWAVGSLGEVLKSTDSGATSTRLNFATSSRLRTVFPVTTSRVSIGGQDSVNNGASVWTTTDGGSNWTVQYNTVAAFPNTVTPSLDRINSLFFLDANTGFAAGGISGNINLIVKTANGGSTWTTVYNDQTIRNNDELNRTFFPSSAIGFAAGNSGAVLKSTNGGDSWTNISANYTCPQADINNCDLHEVMCADINTCYIAGEKGLVAKTTDGGTTWSVLTTGTTEDLSALEVRGNKVWAGGFNGTIIYSENAGSTWTAQTSNTTYIVQEIDMVTDDVGFAACGNTATSTGAILKTTSGGK